ncbi:Uncharacterised protein [Mycobacteroides abscessus subsp. abscessus]|nr:Uncharacterised protein [Mycobacteroides abscessus subsp. abscessus]
MEQRPPVVMIGPEVGWFAPRLSAEHAQMCLKRPEIGIFGHARDGGVTRGYRSSALFAARCACCSATCTSRRPRNISAK